MALWASEEFRGLLASESEQFGQLYNCHRKNGKLCTGWVMDQDRRRTPNLSLRLYFLRNQTTREELDRLFCKVELFPSVPAMVRANFPGLLPGLRRRMRTLHESAETFRWRRC